MSILVYKQRHKNPTEANTPKLNYEHIRYIATRPGVSKNESMRHGLFGCTEPEKGLTEFESLEGYSEDGTGNVLPPH